MARASVETKLQRVMKFHTSLMDPKIARLMSARGFAEEDRAEGWALFERAMGRTHAMPVAAVAEPTSKRLVADIDDWENTWFDVADAALARCYPEVHATLFLNLHKANDLSVIGNVMTFCNRLAELSTSTDPKTQAAIALLEKRGLTTERIDQARALLERLKTDQPEPDPTIDLETIRAEQEQALAKLWAWYKDWSQTARTVIKSKRLRVQMGLSRWGSGGSQGEEVEVEVEEDEGSEAGQAGAGVVGAG